MCLIYGLDRNQRADGDYNSSWEKKTLEEVDLTRRGEEVRTFLVVNRRGPWGEMDAQHTNGGGQQTLNGRWGGQLKKSASWNFSERKEIMLDAVLGKLQGNSQKRREFYGSMGIIRENGIVIPIHR